MKYCFINEKIYIVVLATSTMPQPIVELIDKKMVKIIELFSNNPDKEFYLRQVSKLTGISPATTYRILNQLLKREIIEQRVINRFKLYALKNNEKAKQIAEIFSKKRNALEMFRELVSKMDSVEVVYLLDSKLGDNKANLLIIGRDIDPGELKRIIVKIKEDFDFTINHLTLTHEQYSNMLSMGLFPGRKIILYEKR